MGILSVSALCYNIGAMTNVPPTPDSTTGPDLYLDLTKRSLLNMIYGDREVVYADPQSALKKFAVKAIRGRGLEPVRRKEFNAAKRLEGRDWPTYGQTMLSIDRLNNVQHCVEQVLAEGIRGDLIEAGVWRGGAAILMRAILKAHGVEDRTVYVADSFAGLPPPDKNYPAGRPAFRTIRLRNWRYLDISGRGEVQLRQIWVAGRSGEILKGLV